MEPNQIGMIIIGVVILLAVIGLVVFLARKRSRQHLKDQQEKDRHRAAEMREKAKASEFDAREREAKATMAEAEAQRAEVEAERLRREAEERQRDAQGLRDETLNHSRKADELDPDGKVDRQGHDGR